MTLTQDLKGIGRHILITGGSSGIGAELARQYAEPGVAITLWGRNRRRLSQIADEVRAKGSLVFTRQIDLADSGKAIEAFAEADDELPVDVAILAAGLSHLRSAGKLIESAESALAMAQVNFTTPVVMACEAAERMGRRRKGAIAFIGSVASFHDLPQASVYSGTKAGIGRFSTALAAAMSPHNVSVTLIIPGFIDTPMSQRLKGVGRPFMLTVEKASAKIKRAIEERKLTLMFPWPFHVARILDAHFPRPLVHKFLRIFHVMQRPEKK
ncbi:SDR family NAD(P)-dependent oxidoreductase [Acetobacteraceae bacterium]|nr:SDR family NAD(P)-dependent oxidoreductase [Acetobacteraceae bacterium]